MSIHVAAFLETRKEACAGLAWLHMVPAYGDRLSPIELINSGRYVVRRAMVRVKEGMGKTQSTLYDRLRNRGRVSQSTPAATTIGPAKTATPQGGRCQ
jgi:hypothetical protein